MTERYTPGKNIRTVQTLDMGRPADLLRVTKTTDSRSPMAMVFDAFRRTKLGGNPYQAEDTDSGSFRTALADKLGLVSPVRDGKGLGERFIEADTREDVVAIYDDTDRLSTVVTSIISMAHSEIDKRTANPEGSHESPSEAKVQQRQILKDLVAVAARQFEREMPPDILQHTEPVTIVELKTDGEESNAHIDALTSELLMLTPDNILGDEFRGLRQRVFEHEFTSSVMRHAGAKQDALVVARTIQRELGFTVDEGDGEQLPQAQVFIQRERRAALEPCTIEGVDTMSSEQRHHTLATIMGAETGFSLGNYWVQYETEQEPHRLAPVTI